MEAGIQRVVRFLRSYVCNKLRRMSRRVSFDSPRLQRIESKVVSSKNPFDLCVKFPRYFESIAVPIGSKIGGHPVIRDTHTIWTLLNEDGHRRIRASVNNMLHHFLHDQRIARNDAENSWLDGPILFLENLTLVEPRKLHKPVRLSHRIHFPFRLRFAPLKGSCGMQPYQDDRSARRFGQPPCQRARW